MTEQISFKDIKKGDRIRARHTPDYGVTRTFEGVAHDFAFGNTWYTEEGGLIVDEMTVESITLLERPEPQEPEGVGVVVETDTGVRLVSIHPRPGGNRWVVLRGRMWDRTTTEPAVAWSWEILADAYDSITIVREGV